MSRICAWVAALLVAFAPATFAQAFDDASTAPRSLRLRMLGAEDARDVSPRALEPIIKGLSNADPELRRVAVRAFGRFERPEFADRIAAALSDREASVRTEAVDALAQSVAAQATPEQVLSVASRLRVHLATESHPLVRGAVAASLGRLKYPDDEAGRAAGLQVLEVAFPRDASGARRPASPAVLLNALRGLHFVALGGVAFGPPRRDASGTPVTWLPDEARDQLSALLLGVATARQETTERFPPKAAAIARETPSAAETTMRRLAIQALAGTRQPDPALGLALLDDPDEQVRAIALRWAVETLKDDASRARAVTRWQTLRGGSADAASDAVGERTKRLEGRLSTDPSAQVRFEAIRALAQAELGPRGCVWLLAGLDDADLNVARYALMNARSCAGYEAVRRRLRDLTSADSAPADEANRGWHRYAYALVGLASVDPGAAMPRVLAGMDSAEPWVRRYAALAAGELLYASEGAAPSAPAVAALTQPLARLLDDSDANVATEALRALARRPGAGARGHALRALRRGAAAQGAQGSRGVRPPQSEDELLIDAAAALKPGGADGHASTVAPDAEVATACAAALSRVTVLRRETSRDARLALIECVETRGQAADAASLHPRLRDFDAAVANAAAAAIARLTGRKPAADPQPLPRLPLPSEADLARTASARVVLSIRGRGDIVVRLRPDEAPLNAFRFLRLSESGYYTGLTFHRIVPAFVVQGGSPLGNEYSGDGPFTRDEVGRLANLRGSIGLSTRGRDTGDAQFYVNVADNVRLDHTYTVFAQVESGMEIVDALVEGDVIEAVAVRQFPHHL